MDIILIGLKQICYNCLIYKKKINIINQLNKLID